MPHILTVNTLGQPQTFTLDTKVLLVVCLTMSKVVLLSSIAKAADDTETELSGKVGVSYAATEALGIYGEILLV